MSCHGPVDQNGWRTDFPRVRAVVNDFFMSGLEYNSLRVFSESGSTNVSNEAVPMDIGAPNTGTSGKDKGDKGYQGKGKRQT